MTLCVCPRKNLTRNGRFFFSSLSHKMVFKKLSQLHIHNVVGKHVMKKRCMEICMDLWKSKAARTSIENIIMGDTQPCVVFNFFPGQFEIWGRRSGVEVEWYIYACVGRKGLRQCYQDNQQVGEQPVGKVFGLHLTIRQVCFVNKHPCNKIRQGGNKKPNKQITLNFANWYTSRLIFLSSILQCGFWRRVGLCTRAARETSKIIATTVNWLKYCRYGGKHQSINQSI